MELILARHCETDWNVRGRLQGRSDIPLNDTGRRQAVALAMSLTDMGATHIICSDLKRAAETALIIGRELRLSVRTDVRLAECSFGLLEGLSLAEVEAQLKGSVHAVQDAYDFSPWGGEHRDAVLKRQLDVLRECAALPPLSKPLLVGHGRSLGTLLAHFGELMLREQGVARVVSFNL